MGAGEGEFNVVFVTGGPGSGKGTQCKSAAGKLNWWGWVSAGDELRKEKEAKTEMGKTIMSYIDKGEIVPADITVELLVKAMEKTGMKKILIDGFPRSEDNVTVWDKVTADKATVRGVIDLQVEEDELKKRLASRKEGRTDDEEALIQKRIETHKKQCAPIVDEYRKKKMVIKVDGEGDIPIVRRRFLQAIKDIEAQIPRKLRDADFDKVRDIDPNKLRISFTGKVIEVSQVEGKEQLLEVRIADDSGVVTATIRKFQDDKVALAVVGKVVKLQNCAVRIIDEKIRVEVDRWGLMKASDDTVDEINMDNDVSAIEYELSNGDSDGEKPKGKGKKGKGKGGKGKGKGGKGKGKKGKGKGKGWW